MTARKGHFVDGYLAALLAQASHLISTEFHSIVRRHGLSVSEWRILATLSDGESISIGRLAQITLNKQPTLTRLLDRMQKRAQVQRVPHGLDRRITLVCITPAGLRTVSQLIRLAKKHEQRVLEPFGLARAEQLKTTLRRMIELHRSPAVERDSRARKS